MTNVTPSRSYEQIEYNYLKSRGYTDAGVAGVLGNLQKESDFSPTAYNPTEGAVGIAQWENGRRTNGLDNTAARLGLPETDISAQLAYMGQELNGPYAQVDQYMKSASDPASAANEWNRNYEISGDYTQDREDNAMNIYSRIAQGSPLTGGGAANTAANGGFQGVVAMPVADKVVIDNQDETYFEKKDPYSMPYISKHGDEFNYVLQDKQYNAIRDFINAAPSKEWHIGRDWPTGVIAPDGRTDRIYTLKYPTGNNKTATVTITGDPMFMKTIYEPLIQGKFDPNKVSAQEKKDAGPLGNASDPLMAIAHAVDGVGKAVGLVGTFFDKVTWIFDVSHFFRFMLYLFGGVAILAGLGMITFGSKVGAEE